MSLEPTAMRRVFGIADRHRSWMGAAAAAPPGAVYALAAPYFLVADVQAVVAPPSVRFMAQRVTAARELLHRTCQRLRPLAKHTARREDVAECDGGPWSAEFTHDASDEFDGQVCQ